MKILNTWELYKMLKSGEFARCVEREEFAQRIYGDIVWANTYQPPVLNKDFFNLHWEIED